MQNIGTFGVRVFSYGGGRQSTAVLAMQAMGMLDNPFDRFVFANVGEKSEAPKTLRYFEEIALPFAQKHGISLLQIKREDGVDLLDHVLSEENRSVSIPMYQSGGKPFKRICTSDWKVRVIDRYIKQIGVDWAEVGLGISLDEIERMQSTDWTDVEGVVEADNAYIQDSFLETIVQKKRQPRKLGFWKKKVYPLIDLRVKVSRALEIISEAGLPEPPPSSCFYCPFHSRSKWIQMSIHEPEMFKNAVNIEKAIQEKLSRIGQDKAYLHSSGKPLEDAVKIATTGDLFGDDCGGYCNT